MAVLLIVYKSLRHHIVSTLVSAFAIALAGGLLMAVWVVQQEANRAFTGVTGGFDAVLGARSSKLQLVLNSIFHLEDSPGNIAATDVEAGVALLPASDDVDQNVVQPGLPQVEVHEPGTGDLGSLDMSWHGGERELVVGL